MNKVKKYVDKKLAHEDDGDPSVGFTFGELDAALDTIGAALTDIYLLLKCSSLTSPNPTIINPWRRAFMVPWESDEAVERWQGIQQFIRAREAAGEE